MYEVDQYTVSLLHFEDGLKDECGNTWISTGNATVSTEQKVVGNSSLYTPASSFLTSTNDKYAFGTGDFTIDFWMYYESGYSGVSSSHSSGTGVVIQTDNINFGNSTSSSSLITKTPGFVLNKWAHYALVRKSGIVYWFVNGALQTTITGASNITINQFAINARYGNGSYAGGVAYYDEFRISNIARWTSDFDPEVPPQNPIGHGLLRITMNDSSEREYQLSLDEISKFIEWCNRTVGTGNALYVFDKTYNVGEFKSRKEYLLFEKIISFEVMELTK